MEERGAYQWSEGGTKEAERKEGRTEGRKDAIYNNEKNKGGRKETGGRSVYFSESLSLQKRFPRNTGGMFADNRSSSAMMALPLETNLRRVCPHRLLSAKKSAMMTHRSTVATVRYKRECLYRKKQNKKT